MISRSSINETYSQKRGNIYLTPNIVQETTKKYMVTGYPTLYMIDKTGKICLAEEGFGENTAEKLETEIKKQL